MYSKCSINSSYYDYYYYIATSNSTLCQQLYWVLGEQQ